MADDASSSMTQGFNNLKPRENCDEDIEENGDEHEQEPSIDDDVSPEEFEELNSKMDDIHSALDALEEQNDAIRAKLVELLESNRAARKAFQEQQEEREVDSSDTQ